VGVWVPSRERICFLIGTDGRGCRPGCGSRYLNRRKTWRDSSQCLRSRADFLQICRTLFLHRQLDQNRVQNSPKRMKIRQFCIINALYWLAEIAYATHWFTGRIGAAAISRLSFACTGACSGGGGTADGGGSTECAALESNSSAGRQPRVARATRRWAATTAGWGRHAGT
jgi:hypothetical protein